MSRRTTATVVTLVLLFGTWIFLAVAPAPYVVYSPGPTLNLLGRDKAGRFVRVTGAKTYRDTGALRLLTVMPTGPDEDVSLVSAMGAWFRSDQAVYRYEDVYRPQDTPDKVEQESGAEMVSSQDSAIAAALEQTGHRVPTNVQVIAVRPGGPGDGAFQAHDQLLAVDGTPITSMEEAVRLIQQVPVGHYVRVGIERMGERETLRVRTTESETTPGKSALMITIGVGYDFPMQVTLNIDSNIGGPSAGLMFAIAVYDVLTPGSLTGGKDIAGTGTIAANGDIGPIGGIEQKIAGAEAAGAHLFLAPAWHCDEVRDTSWDKSEMRILKVDTLKNALHDIAVWRAHPHAKLPEC